MPFGKRSSFEQERRDSENARRLEALVDESIRQLGEGPTIEELGQAIAEAYKEFGPKERELTYELDEDYQDL